jgi:hypothetical protein
LSIHVHVMCGFRKYRYRMLFFRIVFKIKVIESRKKHSADDFTKVLSEKGQPNIIKTISLHTVLIAIHVNFFLLICSAFISMHIAQCVKLHRQLYVCTCMIQDLLLGMDICHIW